MVIRIRRPVRNPRMWSYEFFVQNYADVSACINMLFVIGLMIQATSDFCGRFVLMQYPPGNDTKDELYQRGFADIPNVMFDCSLVGAARMAVHDFFLTKITKKLHMSKIKSGQINEAGCLFIFLSICTIWAGDFIIKNDYLLDMSSLWLNYPYAGISFSLKAFYVIQLSFWMQCFPQIFFQRRKWTDFFYKIIGLASYFSLMLMCYAFGFDGVGVVLLFFMYIPEIFSQVARIYVLVDRDEKNIKNAQFAACVAFLVTHFITSVLTLIIFLYGFPQTEIEDAKTQIWKGNFNILPIRLFMVAMIGFSQICLFYSFVNEYSKPLMELFSKLSLWLNLVPVKPIRTGRARMSRKMRARMAARKRRKNANANRDGKGKNRPATAGGGRNPNEKNTGKRNAAAAKGDQKSKAATNKSK